MTNWWLELHPSLEEDCFKHSTIALPAQCDHPDTETNMNTGVIECKACGLQRSIQAHQGTRDPVAATKKWIRRRCSDKRIPTFKECDLRLAESTVAG
jgi:transcription elongation factor Elf1